ncbi:MAG: alpha/beta hydrolase [Myxococcales bacterium]|nr:alpha/beta hydrolase [Myxococcales bacterium]
MRRQVCARISGAGVGDSGSPPVLSSSPETTTVTEPSIRIDTIETPRLRTLVRRAGPEGAPLLLLIHGNVSSSAFWDELLIGLGDRYRVIAPDLRSFGGSEAKGIDATRGVRDFADDLHALLETIAPGEKVHVLGWSVGGGVALQYAIDHADRVASIILEDPMSPFGFGGTKDAEGTPCYPDYAASGGGTANPEFVRLLGERDRGSDNPNSARNVVNNFYFKPPFRLAPEREEALLDAIFEMSLGEAHYPGDMTPSANWPTVAPGTRGMNNAISPKYVDLSAFAAIEARPPVLWIRGADDQIVSDTSLFDFGFLGLLGAVPGWPGAEVFPPQPMVSQTRALLDRYAAAGGRYQELVIPECGHSPHLEHTGRFLEAVGSFLAEAAG